MTKAVTPLIGIDFGSAGGRNDDFAPLTEVNADNGIWTRCIAGTAITTGNALHVAASGTANPITAALAITAGRFAVAPIAVSTGSSFWAQRSGSIASLNVLGSCATGVPLYTSDTAGALDDATASASHYQVQSVQINSTVSGATATSMPATVAGFLTIRRPAA